MHALLPGAWLDRARDRRRRRVVPAVHRDLGRRRRDLREAAARPRRHARVGAARETQVSGAPRATLLAAVVANILGWVLPAISEERGFEAFFVALSPLWDYRHFQNEGLGLIAFIVLS